MEIQHLRCAGLDVHKDTVVACVAVAASILTAAYITCSAMAFRAQFRTGSSLRSISIDATRASSPNA